MKVKDLPGDRELRKVRIPDSLKHEAVMSGLTVMEVYIYSQWFKGIWVKPDLNSGRVYPICVSPREALEWEVVE